MPGFAKAFLYLIYAVILVGLVVAILIAFDRGKANAPGVNTHSSTSKTVSDKSTSKAKPKYSSASTSSSKTSKSTSSNTPAASAKSSTSKTTTTKSTSSSGATTLSDTGPGNVIALFVFVSLTSSLLFRQMLIRRQTS